MSIWLAFAFVPLGFFVDRPFGVGESFTRRLVAGTMREGLRAGGTISLPPVRKAILAQSVSLIDGMNAPSAQASVEDRESASD
jgi:hypothetical protein